MSSVADTAGPIIIWEDYGCEGWHPKSFPSLIDAITAGAITRQSCITYRIMPIRLTPTHTHASILLLKQGRPI